jgi:transposase
MSNRRFEMHEYRQIIARMRLGDTDRAIARTGLMGRKKAARIREIALSHDWLNTARPIPDEAELAGVIPRNGEEPSGSLILPFAQEVTTWHQEGIRGTTIQDALVRKYGFTGSYSAVRRYLQGLPDHHSKATVILDFEPGEAAQVDFGTGPRITDVLTGEVISTWVFVMTLAWSRHQYAEIVTNQKVETWLGCHRRAFEWFGGFPGKVILDNPKCAITKACFYDPVAQRSYADAAEAYGFLISPCPPADPKKKAKVEAGVLLVERWILAALRHRTFFSLAEANQAIRELLIRVNQKPFKKVPGSRLERFLSLDKPAAQPLSGPPYEYADWRKARVNVDVHIEVDGHYYSVPYSLAREQVDVRLTRTTVEVLFKNHRVASHVRSFQKGIYTTRQEHLPPPHQHHRAWTPERILLWTEKIGPYTATVDREILQTKNYPEQGFRACLGLIRLGDRFSPERLEAACQRATRMKQFRYQSIKSILASGLDRQSLIPIPEPPIRLHPHIRGKDYYQ